MEEPWWIAADSTSKSNFRTITPGARNSANRSNEKGLGRTIGIALLAGIVGAVLATNLNITPLRYSAKLVTTSNTIERAPDSVAGIAKRVLPSVVSIAINSPGGTGTGSGFIIDSNGYILTNNHVVETFATGGGTLTVTLNDGSSQEAKIVGRDSSYDLAVIKIARTGLSALQFGDSDNVQVGDAVIAIGSPLGLSGTVTSGIISAKNRPVTSGSGNGGGESSFINALQTDAAVNPGNSGGPLVDATGAVIGVNSAIASLGSSFGGQSGSIGLGFAIPINQARRTADQLIKNGKATYPILGISLDLSYTGAGARIADVASAISSGSPAEKAGLKPGDVITRFDGNAIAKGDDLIVAVRAKAIGDRVAIEYLRGSKSGKISLQLAGSASR
jgi:putative serine protease PepD